MNHPHLVKILSDKNLTDEYKDAVLDLELAKAELKGSAEAWDKAINVVRGGGKSWETPTTTQKE